MTGPAPAPAAPLPAAGRRALARSAEQESRAPVCSVSVPFGPNRGRGGGGSRRGRYGRGDLRDVQVAGFLDGRDDGGADGGQVDRPAAGPAGGGIFAEGHVADVMVRLDGPVLADQAGQVGRGGVGAGEAGDGGDGLADGLAGGGVAPPAGDLDGLAGAGELQVADVGALQRAGLGAAAPGLAAGNAAGTCRQGRALIRACSTLLWRYQGDEQRLVRDAGRADPGTADDRASERLPGRSTNAKPA